MFSMDLASGASAGHVVVTLRGELDIVNAAAVAAALETAAARGPRVIVDLAELDFIDASGVGALARGRKRARDDGGDLLLVAPQRRVRVVLEIIWEAAGGRLYPSVAEAAAGPGAGRLEVVPIRRPPAETPLPAVS
jgi:anti-sigma B factor antagonist